MRDFGEDPIVGRIVNFLGPEGGGAWTDFGGFYSISDVPAGDYIVFISVPGYRPTTTNPVTGVVVPPNTTIDFGLIPNVTTGPTPPPPTTPPPQPLTVSIWTDKSTYAPGEDVTFTLRSVGLRMLRFS